MQLKKEKLAQRIQEVSLVTVSVDCKVHCLKMLCGGEGGGREGGRERGGGGAGSKEKVQELRVHTELMYCG